MIKLVKTIVCFFSISAVFSQKQILPDFHADPSAHIWDGKLWLYPSTDEPGSTKWEHMIRWHCYSTTDLENWKNEGEIFSLKKISWAEHSAFAPDAMKWKDKYYFFFPAQYQIGVAVSDKPNGPFEDALGRPLIEEYQCKGVSTFDPTIYIDTDNTPYIYYGGWGGAAVVRLKDNLLELDEEIKKIDLPNYSEGIWVHKIKDTYYFTYPIPIKRNGKTKSLLAYCTSKTPYGPFEYHGAFFDNDSYNSHHSFIEIDGQWYLFYHIEGPSKFERRVCVEYIDFNEDGTIKEVKMTKEGVKSIDKKHLQSITK